jgi:hypothetical protein
MHHRLRALLAPLLSAAVLALAATAASAITIGPGGVGTLSGRVTFAGPRIAFACNPVTLATTTTAGTYAAGAAIGTVDSATTAGCTLRVTTILGLPAAITIEDLTATPALPFSIPIQVLAQIAGSNCLWSGTLRVTTATGATGTIDSTQVFTPTAGSLTAAFCASSLGNVSPSGTLAISPNWTITLP